VIDIGLHRLQIRILLVLCIPSANCTKNRNHKAAIAQHNVVDLTTKEMKMKRKWNCKCYKVEYSSGLTNLSLLKLRK